MGRIETVLVLTLTSACGMSVGDVEGAGFLPSDAVYTKWAESDGKDGNVVFLLSDAEDVCAGSGLRAGESALLIYRRWTGSSAMVLEQYGDECAMGNRIVAAGGWVSLDTEELDPLGVDFMFALPERMLQGRIQARWCPDIDPKTATDCRH